MTNSLHISTISLTLALALLFGLGAARGPASSSGSTTVAESAAPGGATVGYTPAQEQLVDFGRSRFALAGIDLPDIDIEFPTDRRGCDGWGGVYVPDDLTVRICRPSKSTMVHELAHAWAETALDAADRQAFLELRGLDRWIGGADWEQRGAEQAAEILTWGLMDEDITVRWLETAADGSTSYTWRLFKVADSEPEQLVAAYEQLTGSLPSLRVLDPACDASPIEISNPEANR